MLLVGPGGRMVKAQVLGLVAEPVELTGSVQLLDDLRVLEADPAAFHRLLEP